MAFCGIQRKKKLIALVAVLSLLVSTLVLSSCTTEQDKTDFSKLSEDELAEYGKLGEYKGMTVVLKKAQSKEEAVWEKVIENMSEGEKTKPEQIYYYYTQLEKEYDFHAEKLGISKEELYKDLGIKDGDVFKEAEKMTKKDIACALVRKAESIEITAEEKEKYYSRYVEKYVSDYGYTKEYVEENMKDIVEASMLYDKITQFLIANNKFTNE